MCGKLVNSPTSLVMLEIYSWQLYMLPPTYLQRPFSLKKSLSHSEYVGKIRMIKPYV